MALDDLVLRTVKKYLHRTAVIFDNGSNAVHITYQELWERVEEIKTALAKYLRQGQLVAVLLTPSCDLPIVLLSILSSSCAFYPMSSDGLKYSINGMKRVEASWLLLHSSYEQAILKEYDHLKAHVIPNQILLKYQLKLLELPFEPSAASSTEFGPLAYCITTSGTTSQPKVVKVPHSCILLNVLSLRDILGVTCSDKCLLSSPLTFDPSVIDIFVSLSSGGTLLIVPDEIKKNPAKLLYVIHNRQAVTVLQATPSLIRRFSPHYLKRTILGIETSLRVLALGGEQFPSGVEFSRWRDPGNKTKFFNLYGITEVSCWASCQQIDVESLIKHNIPVPIGDALNKTLVKISSPDNSNISNEGNILIGSAERVCFLDIGADIDTDHEITLKTNTNTILLDSDAEKREAECDSEKRVIWRDSGDLGKLMADGSILYLGRKDDQIKRNGKRLNISAIEEVCCQLQSISDCRVLQNEDNRLIAFIITISSANHSSKKLQILKKDEAGDNVSSKYNLPIVSSYPFVSTRESNGGQDQLNDEEVLERDTNGIDNQITNNILTGKADSKWEKLKGILIKRLKQALPSHYMPDVFIELNQPFPVTSHGKLDKISLLKLAHETEANAKLLFECPRTWALKHWLVHLPAGIEVVKEEDNFLSLGGDSLAALRLVNSMDESVADAGIDFLDVLFSSSFSHFVEKLLLMLEQHESLKTSNEEVLSEKKLAELHHNVEKDHFVIENNLNPNSYEYEDSKEMFSSVAVTNMYKHTSDMETGTPFAKILCEDSSHDSKCSTILLEDISRHKTISSDGIRDVRRIISKGNRIVYPTDKHQQIPTKHAHPQQSYQGLPEECSNKGDDEMRSVLSSAEFKSHTNSPEEKNANSSTSAEKTVSNLKPVWKHNTDKCVDASPTIVVFEDKTLVFIGSHSGQFCAIDINSGEPVWTTNLPDRIESSACCTLTLEFVIVGCYDGRIYSLNIQSGNVEWCFKTQDIVKCSPAVDKTSGHVICGSHDGNIYCLDIENKQCVWRKALNGGGVLATPLICHVTNIVFVAALRGKICALKSSDGQHVWCLDLKKPVFSSPCFHDRSILIGCTDNTLYCIDKTGSIEWKFKTKGPIFSSPVSLRGCILFGCHDDYIYCLDSSGQFNWSILGKSTIFSTPFIFQFQCGREKRYEYNDKNTSHFLSQNSFINSVANDSVDVNIYKEPKKKIAKYMNSQESPATAIYKRQFSRSEKDSSQTIDRAVSETGMNNLTWDSFAIDESITEKMNGESQTETETLKRTEDMNDIFIAVASSNGTLYVIDIESGRIVSQMTLPGEVFSSPVVCDNKILVGCRDNFIYCYDFVIT